MTLWEKVTSDKYELPLAVADSVPELAKILGVSETSIYSSLSHNRKEGRHTAYRKVEIPDDEVFA